MASSERRGRSSRGAVGLALVWACTLTACGVAPGPTPVSPVAVEASADSVAEPPGFFWKGRGYGTDAYAGPFDLLLNKGMSIAQWNDLSRDLSEIDFQW